MNGAAAVVDRNASAARISRTATIGSSHHFLLARRKCHG
jgi:hypothetical protein